MSIKNEAMIEHSRQIKEDIEAALAQAERFNCKGLICQNCALNKTIICMTLSNIDHLARHGIKIDTTNKTCEISEDLYK